MPVITTVVATALATAAEKLVGLSQKLDELATNRLLREHVIPVREEILRVKELVFEAKQAQFSEVAKLQQEHANEKSALQKHNDELIATIQRLESPDKQLALDETKTAILVFLSDGQERPSYEIAAHLKIGEEFAIFHLNDLADMTPKMIYVFSNASPRVLTKYSIAQDGRRYLVQHGLLK
jgi:hypothetical protein